MNTIIAVFLGGGIGAVMRFLISKLTLIFYQGNFPLATLIANMLACFVLALLVYKAIDFKWISENSKLLLIVGFCGGLSTFSTYSIETFDLLKNGAFGWAIANIVISTAICLFIVYVIYRKMI